VGIARPVLTGTGLKASPERKDERRGEARVTFWQNEENFLAELPRGYEYAVEFRHRSWLDAQVMEILRRHRVAQVSVSSRAMPMDLTVTSDLVYIRFHGLGGGAAHDYSRAELKPWANHIRRQMRCGRQVFAYFNNDANVRAPANAQLLREMVGVGRSASTTAAEEELVAGRAG
jgi:uncharacterized protein YecE (DUF72 family)